MNAVFTNRREAGQKLTKQLLKYTNQPKAIVWELLRGGVPVAYEIANKLNLPLKVCLVRKLAFPENPQLAIGAVAENTLIHNCGNYITIVITIVAREQVQISKLDRKEVLAIAVKEKAELRWRESCYRHSRPRLAIAKRTIKDISRCSKGYRSAYGID